MILVRLSFRFVGLVIALLLISVLADSVGQVWSALDPVLAALDGSAPVESGWTADAQALAGWGADVVHSVVQFVDRLVARW